MIPADFLTRFCCGLQVLLTFLVVFCLLWLGPGVVGLDRFPSSEPGRTPSFTSLAAASAIPKARANALFAPSRGTVLVFAPRARAVHHIVPGPDLAMICCEQTKSVARAQRCM